MSDYLLVDIALPAKTMAVKWICEDGIEDCGFFDFNDKEFVTFDSMSVAPIISWKPLINLP
jgi:hypothetical protein